MINLKNFLFIAVVLFFLNTAFALAAVDENAKIRFLHHSTGGNLYSQGNVADWFSSYNSTNGTNYNISEINYPTNGYPWNNYPYDWWNLWVTENPDDTPRTPACQSGNANMECLDNLTTQYDVIIFKQCFPGADIGPDTGNPDVTSSVKTLENYKEQYRAIRKELDKYPNNLFIVWTLVPLHRLATNAEKAARAKEFVDWVNNDWLTEDGNNHPNIKIFDFWSYVVESNPNPTNGQVNTLKYEYERSHTGSDSHPNTLANQTVGPIFSQAIVDDINDFFANTSTTPSISSISGDISDGGMITVSGSGFSTYEDASPDNPEFLNLAWNDFNDGDLLAGGFRHSHDGVYSSAWEISLENPRTNGNSYARKFYQPLNMHPRLGSIEVNQDINSDDWYWTFWFMLENNSQSGKITRIWGDGNPSRNMYLSTGGDNTMIRGFFEYVDATTVWSSPDSINYEEWHRIAIHMNKNTGNVSVFLDNKKEWDRNWVPDDFNGMGHTWDFGSMIDEGEGAYNYDDVYFSYTQSRVEICDTLTWDDTTQKHCEIQIPTSWSPTSITFTFNQGSFNTGDAAYLFVVDENGAVNETGFPITIGNSNSSQYRADVDNNSQINTTDAMLTLRNSLGLSMSGTNWQSFSTTGDVNCDGNSNSTDAMLILRYSLGLDMSETGWCI